jgi:hypothetical protein
MNTLQSSNQTHIIYRTEFLYGLIQAVRFVQPGCCEAGLQMLSPFLSGGVVLGFQQGSVSCRRGCRSPPPPPFSFIFLRIVVDFGILSKTEEEIN